MRIVIIDDDQLVALSLKTILETKEDICVLATGSSASEGYALYKEHKPDILLMDIRMNGENGLDAGEKILLEFPDAKILFLTTFSDDEYIIKSLHMGAKGYLLKQDFESIAPALEAVYKGQTVFGNEVITKLPNMLGTYSSPTAGNNPGLSDREFDILKLVADGMNNKEIASALYLSEGTVRNYLSTILEKLELRDRTQLAVYYYKNCV